MPTIVLLLSGSIGPNRTTHCGKSRYNPPIFANAVRRLFKQANSMDTPRRPMPLWVLVVVVLGPIVTVGANVVLVQMGNCDKPEHYEVSRVRGRVVGASLGPFQFRWLRRMVAGSSATLRLSTHQVPYTAGDPYPKLLGVIKADPSGSFDFGDIPPGEYALGVNRTYGEAGVMFHFAVTPSVRNSEILIDASPAPYCNCCGWDFEPR